MAENSNDFDGLLEPVESVADEQFYERADAFIALANELSDNTDNEEFATSASKVSASLMYANARFNIWLTACGYSKAEDLKAFNTNGYYFDAESSLAGELVFKRDEQAA